MVGAHGQLMSHVMWANAALEQIQVTIECLLFA
jgi:hypothetical protein